MLRSNGQRWRLLLLLTITLGSAAGVPTDATDGGPQTAPARAPSRQIEISDQSRLRSALDPQLAPDDAHLMFTVQYNDRPGAPYTRIWSADLSTGTVRPWGGAEGVEGNGPRWSPDGKRVAFMGSTGSGRSGIVVASADGTSAPAAGRHHRLESPAAASRCGTRLVAGRKQDRVRLRDPGSRAADGSRSHRDHALLVSARVRSRRSLQRQPAAAPVRG